MFERLRAGSLALAGSSACVGNWLEQWLCCLGEKGGEGENRVSLDVVLWLLLSRDTPSPARTSV